MDLECISYVMIATNKFKKKCRFNDYVFLSLLNLSLSPSSSSPIPLFLFHRPPTSFKISKVI
jgi:hypothetical protein